MLNSLRILSVPVVLALLLASPSVQAQATQPATGAAHRFADAKGDRVKLRALLREMPKGANLHAHLSGELASRMIIEHAKDGGFLIRSNEGQIGHIGLLRDVSYKIVSPDTVHSERERVTVRFTIGVRRGQPTTDSELSAAFAAVSDNLDNRNC